MKRIITKIAVLLIAGAALCATGCTKAKADNGKDNQDGEYITRAEFEHYQEVVSGELLTLDLRLQAVENALSDLLE